ncbi:MAG: hypothetical protein E6Q97_25720 [Desulfurellales bacterium]|nr:MAG: hypothetical protein E6Q97_25720 [Desulfurellales bacterium]
MGLGLGNKGKVSSSNKTSLPSYVNGAYNKLIKGAKQASNQKFKPYPGSPLGAESPMVGQSYGALKDYMGSNWQQPYQEAQGIYGGIEDASSPFLNYQANGINYNGPAGYDPTTFTNQNVVAGEWNQEQADKYMNPYIKSVLDVNKNQAILDFQRAQIGRNDGAVQAGAFGGSRHGVVDALSQEALMRNMANIQATGMNDAWNQAMQAFGGDRDAALQAAVANQGANLESQRQTEASRQYGYNQSMTQADRNMEAQKLTEDFRQSGANIGLEALQARINAAKGMSDIATNQNNQQLAMIDTMNKYGLQQTARDQALKDFEMQNFYNKRNNKKNNLDWLSGILNGVPVTTQTENYSYTNPYSQFLGIATAGLGAYNTFFNNQNNNQQGGTLY